MKENVELWVSISC